MNDEPETKIAPAIAHTGQLPDHLKPFADFLREFNKETARGACLAAAAMLDDLLEQVINAFLIQNESLKKLTRGFNAPLGTLSARIAAAHALGLISDEECQECELIRKIRNEFAHKVQMSFDDTRVRGLCSSLTMAAKSYPHLSVGTRGQFTTAAVALIVGFTNRPHYVRQRALRYEEWK